MLALVQHCRPWIVAFPLVAALAGCSQRQNAAPVSGKVSLRGKPLAEIGVTFEPVGTGAGRGSFGRTDSSGQFTLRFIDNDQAGALIGPHRVTFADLQNVGGLDEPDAGPALPRRKSRLPARALEEPREFEVKTDANEANFDFN